MIFNFLCSVLHIIFMSLSGVVLFVLRSPGSLLSICYVSWWIFSSGHFDVSRSSATCAMSFFSDVKSLSTMKVKRKRIMIVFIIDRESGLKFFVYFYRMSGNNYILLTLLFMKKTVSWRCNTLGGNIDTYYRKYTFSKKQNPFFHTNSSTTIYCCKSKAIWSTKPAHVEISW